MITHVDLYLPRARKPYATNVPIDEVAEDASEVRAIRAALGRTGRFQFGQRGTIVKPTTSQEKD